MATIIPIENQMLYCLKSNKYRAANNADMPAAKMPEMAPSQVLPGEIAGINLVLPNNLPPRYAKVSLIQIMQNNISKKVGGIAKPKIYRNKKGTKI